MRRSALFLSPEAPYPAAGGGSLRSASLLEYLGAHYDTDAVFFREPSAPDPRKWLPDGLVCNAAVIDLPFHSRSTLARAHRNAIRYLAGRAPLNDRFRGFGGALLKILEDRTYDLAVVEHFWCAPYAEQLAPRVKKLVLDLHNVESAFYASCADAASWPASMMLRRFAQAANRLERQWLPRFAEMLTTSREDAERIRALCRGAKISVYPNTIPLVSPPLREAQHTIVFSGNFEYAPNISAVRYFRTCVWPLLRERFPKLVWRLVGRNPQGVERYVRGDDRIEMCGAVGDAIAALAAAEVAVVPLLAGSGTRIKILEAWAAARPVVSTTLGAEGLEARPGEHLLLADSPEAFTAAVARLLESPALRAQLGAAGRFFYEEHFTYQQGWRILETIEL